MPDGSTQAERLAKVVALMESDRDGEALAALRMTRAMLAAEGLRMADLIALHADAPADPRRMPAARHRDVRSFAERIRHLTAVNAALRADIDRKSREIAEGRRAIGWLRRKIDDLERGLDSSRSETGGWRGRAWHLLWQVEGRTPQ